jgi:hypothetical protein
MEGGNMLGITTAFWWTVGVLVWLAVILWTLNIAIKRGRSGVGWGLLAAVFGLIATLVLVLMKPKTSGAA